MRGPARAEDRSRTWRAATASGSSTRSSGSAPRPCTASPHPLGDAAPAPAGPALPRGGRDGRTDRGPGRARDHGARGLPARPPGPHPRPLPPAVPRPRHPRPEPPDRAGRRRRGLGGAAAGAGGHPHPRQPRRDPARPWPGRPDHPGRVGEEPAQPGRQPARPGGRRQRVRLRGGDRDLPLGADRPHDGARPAGAALALDRGDPRPPLRGADPPGPHPRPQLVAVLRPVAAQRRSCAT